MLIGLLAGCSGGSGGDEATRTEISTNAITFSAAGPSADTPGAQVFTATFGQDIAHLAVVHSGDAIASATSVMNGRTAEITVVPTAPGSVGPGLLVGAVAVTGYTCADATCSKLSAGSTSTVAVNYQISPVIERVAPYVATAGATDTVIIRGFGFRAFNVTGVRFGDTAATSITVNNTGTLILATHPALTAGSYAVHVDASNHQGDIPSTVSLVVQDPPAYAATTLAHLPTTSAVRSLIYDAERHALLLVTEIPSTSNPVVRYGFENGAWAAPTAVSGSFLDAALSADGKQIYGITGAALLPVDPVTLALGAGVAAPSLAENSALKSIVVGNDNRALITTSLTTSGLTQGYIYVPETSFIGLNGTALNNGTPAMAGNGSAAIVVQGDASLTAAPTVYVYSTEGNSLTSGAPTLIQNGARPAIDRAINRLVLNNTRVYNGSLEFFGTLPDTTTAVVLKPDGNRAYAYDATAGGILVYDTSVDREEAAYAALGAVTPLVGNPGSGVLMTISPDGGTLFLAGSTQIVVQPTPAL